MINYKPALRQARSQRGYTLVELLVVMVVTITVGFIVVSVLVSSLRGTNKATTIETVRQNGNYTILQMSRMIEFAQGFVGVSLDGTPSSYSISCPLQSPALQYKYLKITSFDGGSTTFACNFSVNPAVIASNSASFINTNEVSLSACYFTCTRNNLSQPPTIGINFTLEQQSSSSLFEKRASIPFSTSVVIRNLNK